VEELESRQLLAAPTVVEQVFLERLNEARANPAAYGSSIGLDLSGVAPAQPLAFDTRLIEAAHNHSVDMSNRRFFDHVNPSGAGPGQRLTAAGYPWTSYGESIAAGYPTPESALRGLIIDAGVPDLGHRRHLLAIDAAFATHRQVGVGILQNGTGPYVHYYTIDTASTADSRPFLTGVVYTDSNGNGRYDAGEGLGGVTITVAGIGSIQTWATGGYSFQLSPGAYTVTVSGGALGAGITRTVGIGSSNVRLNFTPTGGDPGTPEPGTLEAYVHRVYERVLNRTPSSGDIAFWTSYGAVHGIYGIINAVERSVEARDRQVRAWYATYLGRNPAGGENQFWVNMLVGGASEEQVLASLLGSAEYVQRMAGIYGGGSSGFIQGLYNQVLGRSASSNEVGYWLSVLPRTGTAGVATFFVHSTEYRTGQIRTYYTTLMRRTPSSSEVAYWVGSGIDLSSIRIFFETSPEFISG
jgi:uncharacterized protein YkwD